MKLHLPSALRKALLAVSVVSMTVAGTTQAAIMHPSVSLQTYTDFGSNMGRYSIYQQNELLKHLNSKGVYISYTQGQKNYKLEHGMISYESMVDGGPFTAISYNATATVQHNGVTNPVFTGRFIGSDQAIHYAGIEYRSCENNTFLLTPQIDYKITRISKVITDITPSALYDARAHKLAGEDINDMLQYRAGGGYMQQADETGKTTWLAGAYAYVVGGIVDNWSFGYSSGYDYKTGTPAIRDGRGMPDDSYTLSIKGVIDFKPENAGTASHPLPFVTQGGDSGSPVWVWDTYSESYQLISCHQARGSYDSYSRGASEWTKATLKSFCVDVDMDKAGHTVHIGEIQVVADKSETIEALANGSTHASTTTKYGKVFSANGEVNEYFIGIEHGKNTWLNLYDLKDGQKTDASGTTKNVNWYAYGNEYLNATNTATSDIQYADLFMTENLVFMSSATDNNVILDADVDLGIGYAQFSAKEGSTDVSYTIQGKDGNNSLQFNHAGYIIDKDVDVHVNLVNNGKDKDGTTDYFREWRKTGEGDLYLEGTGDNHIFLNVGGKGTTYLDEKNGGYAAYNVLINNGATVNLGGKMEQVKRDVTFGYGGGVLDFAGNVNMEWNNTNNAEAPGFTIHALTQDAIITNTTGTTTLTYREGGNTNFLGSFKDTADSSLNIVYAGNGIWTLNSIHTDLKNGGLEVQTGTVKLVGTLTEHAQGSLTGYNQQRYSNPDDWHYADAAMNVTVNSGATFELGSHARLTGNVAVQDGGIFQMDEGVRHQKEYIEGWYELEDTYKIATYYGLYGDVNLQGTNSMMKVQFSVGTDANTTVTGKISGKGGMTVDTAGGSLTLSGANTFEGTKTVTNGLLVLADANAAGDTREHKWVLQNKAQLAVKDTSAAQALTLVDKSSSGVLVLTANETGEPIDMAGHESLIIGAEQGQEIQFGAEESEHALKAVNHKWNLGGGGGNLVVNYQLQDESATLVLGNQYTTGSVTLTNTHNKIGAIDFAGKVTLAYTNQLALGKADINLSYTNRIMGAEGTVDLIKTNAAGVMLLDNMTDQDINLSGHTGLHLGSTGDIVYKGNISLDEGADSYYFGGITGTLVIDKALTDQNDGWTSLVLDGQTYSGGVLELQKALQIRGIVSITGHDEERKVTGGDITLKVNEANSFDSITGIWLYAGGTLDINGYDQTLYYIDASAGSRIIDSSKDKKGTLKIDSDFSSLEGTVDVGTLVINASSESHLYLRGENIYRDFNIESGQVHVESQQALCATGRTVLEKDAKMIITDCTATANLELQGSTVALGEVHDKETISVDGHLAGTLSVAAGTTGTVNFAVDGSTLSAVVDTGEKGRLKLTGNRGTVSSSLINADGSEEGASGEQASGGNVDVELKELRLQSRSSITIGGTLNLVGQENQTSHKKELILSSWGSANNMERDISHMNVEKGLALTIQEDSWNTIWNIHKLTGEGNITWNSKTQHWFSSRIVLDGSNDFEGTFKAERTAADSAGRLYGSFVELAHDEALQKATLEMLGKEAGKETDSARSMMTLALNTDNAKLLGLKGNELTAIYAGASIEGESKTGAPLKTAPYSVRSATLTITGNEDYEFKGKVFGAAEGDKSGAGVDLVMAGTGTGTQKFSGETVQFNNVTVQSGTLVLASTGLDIADRATIYRGATLDMAGSAFNLEKGTTLMVAGTAQQQATLNATLQLGGGTLGFDGSSLSINADTYALATSGLNADTQQSLNILFESTFALQEGTYKLASGNGWSSITHDNYKAVGLDYYDAKFTTDGGLSVTLSLKDHSFIWLGDNANATWDDSHFGISPNVPAENDTVVFNNQAENQNVQVEGSQQAAVLLFDSTLAYTVAGNVNSDNLTAGSLRQTGSGTTTLGNGVNIAGLAEIKAGTLVLEEGSQVHNASVAADAALHLKSAHALTDTVEGDGVVKVAWNAGATGSVKLGEKGIGAMVVESGTLEVTEAVNVQRQLAVTESGTLRSSTGNILKQEDMPLELGGKLVIDHSGNTELKLATTITGEGDKLGAIEKTGTGRLTITSSVAADSLTVNQGSVYITEDAYLADFLANTKNLVVKNGRAELGGNAFTHNTDGYATNLSIDGSDAILHLALGQSSTKTFQGGLSVKNGGKLELHDGGLQINGDICLGAGASDRVTLWGNWGEANNVNKAGIILAGEVSGEGTVALQKGEKGNMERFTLSNEKNSFAGTFEVNSKTSLVVEADKAISHASVALNDGSLILGSDTIDTRQLSGTGSIDKAADQETTKLVLMEGSGHYQGSIGAGISIVKNGAGTQMFSGSAQEFSGSVTVNAGTLSIGAGAMEMLNKASTTTLAQGATLQLGGAAELTGDATLNGTIAIGGTIATRANLSVGEHTHIILGGSSYQQDGNVRIYTVFAAESGGKVSGWENLKADDFSGFGSEARGANIAMRDNYTVRVDTSKVNNLDITWSEDVAAGTWDLHSANFAESGERTAYFEGDTVTIASNADIIMGQAVNLQGGAGTLNVQNGVHASIAQTADNTLTMDVLHVKDNSEFSINSVAGNFAKTAIVETGSTLETVVKAANASGTATNLQGTGTFRVLNTGTLDLGNTSVTGGNVEASSFTGTLALGNGTQQMRFRSSNVTGLSGDATIEVADKAQYWVTDNGGVVSANLILHGNSGAAKGNSWNSEGFGAVRGAMGFTGEVTIDGNAMVSGATDITFNGNIKGTGDNDTLTFGCYYGSQAAQAYTLADGMKTENLANMVVRQSGNNATTVNVNSAEGLADNLKFADGAGNNKAIVNVNASNSIQRLESTAGNGVVNIAAGKTLALAEGADYGGQLKLAEDVTFTANDKTATAKVKGFVKFESAEADQASITGADGTRIENAIIDLAAGTRLEMANVVLASSSSITDASATLVANGLVVEADKTNLADGEIYNSVAGALTPLTYGATATPEEAPAGQIACFTLSNIQDVAIEGTGLVVSLTGDSSQMLGGADWLRLSLSNEGKFTEGLDVTLLYEDAAGQQRSTQGVYTFEGVEAQAAAEEATRQYDYVYFRITGTVPEPATGTLSLLALAALAARRRRK